MEPVQNISDPDIEELKEIVKRQGQVIEETNKIVHGMRRNARLKLFWSILWWGAIIAVSWGAYYYYVQPYVVQLEQYYANFRQQASKAQSLESQVSQWLHQFAPGSGATTTAQ